MSAFIPSVSIIEAFQRVTDPRVDRCKKHSLWEILIIALGSTITGGKGWEDMVFFAEEHEDWLRRFLPLPHGIPSADTFARVFCLLKPREFERIFQLWTTALAGCDERIIALDGKEIKGKRNPLKMISAWCKANGGLCFGQHLIPEGSNEISELPELLKILELRGALFTMDAAHCQKKTLEMIVDGGGDYLVTVKGNQGKLHDSLKAFFDGPGAELGAPMVESYQVEKGHGRVEERRVLISSEVEWIDDLKWAGLRTIAMCESTRTLKDKTTTTRRYFISSSTPDVKRIATAIRDHWHVENKLHWVLDCCFDEDRSKIYARNAQSNLAVMRKISLNKLKILKREGSKWAKLSYKKMMRLCDLRKEVFLEVLTT